MLLTLLSVASLLPPAPQLAGIWSSPLGERAPLRAVCCTVAGSGEDVSMADENRPLAQIEIHADAASADAASLPDFVALGVSVPGVVENLAAQKIIRPNALQRAAFAEIAAGRDAILHAWTGSGKTLAFLLPLLERLDPKERSPQLLIICPSRELAFQIARVAEMVLAGSGMSAAAVVGGANPNRQLEKIKKERPSVIVGTPGRVCELAFDWQKLKLQRIRHVVIDEVDAALKPPHLDHCQQLLHSTQDGRPLQLVLASATADTPPVRRVAAQLLKSPLMLRLRPPASSADGGTGDDANDDAGDEDGGGNAEGALSALGAQLPSSITHGLMVISPNKGLKQVHALRAQQHSVSSVAGSVLGNHQGKRPVGLSHIKHQQISSSFLFHLKAAYSCWPLIAMITAISTTTHQSDTSECFIVLCACRAILGAIVAELINLGKD